MLSGQTFGKQSRYKQNAIPNLGIELTKQKVVGAILVLALFAFEIFNFDTTRYALSNLLGDVNFAGLRWAAILAIAFCAIDFAGLAHLFTPEEGKDEPKEIWYLTGAWLLGATMNALMTWWAVSLTLLNHDFGNEVLSRQVLLDVVPVFVAVLVWITRILFIGAFSVAGERIFKAEQQAVSAQREASTQRRAAQPTQARRAPKPAPASKPSPRAPKRESNQRIYRRPPMPARPAMSMSPPRKQS